jgi:Peptidase inhibitor I78 family
MLMSTFTRRAVLALSALGLLIKPAQASGDRRMATDDVAITPELTSVQGMVGKRLRVIRPNQPVTMDYSPDRVNVEVDDSDMIQRVFIG